MSKCIGAAVGGLRHAHAKYAMSLRERHLRPNKQSLATFATRCFGREKPAATGAQRRVSEIIAPRPLALACAAQLVYALGCALSGLRPADRRGAGGPPALFSLAISMLVSVQLLTLRGSSLAAPTSQGALVRL